MGEFVNSERVEANYLEFEKMRRRVWAAPLAEVAALADRVRVAQMIEQVKISGPTRRFYRDYAAFLDAMVEARSRTEAVPRVPAYRMLLAYCRRLSGRSR